MCQQAADRWQSLRPMPTARGGLSLVALTVPAPMLVAAGGFHCTDGPAHTQSLDAVEVYDLRSGAWRAAGVLPAVRALGVAVPTGNDSFMIAGGA